MKTQFFPSDQLPFEAISENVSSRFVSGEKLTVANFKLKKGGIVPLHHHLSEQVSFCLSGIYKITVQGHAYLLKSGDFLLIPSNIPHQGEAIEDALVIESFSPPRLDWKKS